MAYSELFIFGETVLCSLPYLNNYTENDQSLIRHAKMDKNGKICIVLTCRHVLAS